MGAQVSLAHLLLHRGWLLEPGGGRNLRLHDQPADRSFLHAGPQHHGRARPRRLLWCLWHARPGSHLDVSARTAGRPRVEGRFAELFLLGDERRPDGDDCAEPVARRVAADRGFSQTWLLVFAQRRVPRPGPHADPGWLRMPGDTLFAIGAIAFVVFVFGLGLGYSLKDKGESPARAADRSVRAIGSR